MSINYRHDYNREIRAWLLSVFDYTRRIPAEALMKRPCPVCGGVELSHFVNNGRLDYDRCASCGLVFQNPTFRPDTINKGFEGDDDLLRAYFDIAMRYKGDIPAKPDPETHGKLKDIFALKKNGRLLDVGCSVGDFLHLAKHFFEVEGVEVNPATAAVAEKHFTVHKKYLHELALRPAYDIVTLHQILYGVPDPAGLLCDIHRVLKQDGVLYINTPNSDSYATRLFGGKCCHFYGYTSANVFNPRALRELAERTGFRVVKLRTEWLDIYTPDVMELLDSPDNFIHKRNCHLPNYEQSIHLEDEAHRKQGVDLGMGGNYIVAVLTKS